LSRHARHKYIIDIKTQRTPEPIHQGRKTRLAREGCGKIQPRPAAIQKQAKARKIREPNRRNLGCGRCRFSRSLNHPAYLPTHPRLPAPCSVTVPVCPIRPNHSHGGASPGRHARLAARSHHPDTTEPANTGHQGDNTADVHYPTRAGNAVTAPPALCNAQAEPPRPSCGSSCAQSPATARTASHPWAHDRQGHRAAA